MNNKKLIKEIILEKNSKAMFLEKEFDKALIGYSIPCGQKYVATYNGDECIKILMKTLNISELEALEQFQITSELSNPSENKPILFTNLTNIKELENFNINKDTTIDEIN